jgi:hypothetical protein
MLNNTDNAADIGVFQSGNDVWNGYPGMIFWENAVLYLEEKFTRFDITKLVLSIDEQTLFEIKAAFSYDRRNWSEPRLLSDWESESEYLEENAQYSELSYVWISLWFSKTRPNTRYTGTLDIRQNTDKNIYICKVSSIAYDGAAIDHNDETKVRVQPFHNVIDHYPKWNFYDNQQVNIRRWKDMCRSTLYSHGHVAVWFKTLPVESETSSTFANHVLRNVVSIKKLAIISPNNEIPSEKQVYTEWDMPLMDDFVIHVVDELFKNAFGENTVPLQKDYLYIPMLDRIFKVSNVQPSDKRFMGKVGWWECYLAKYEDDSTVGMASGLKEEMSKFGDIDEAMEGFNVIEELEEIKEDTVISAETISHATADEKKAVNENYSNLLVDSTAFVDLKDTEHQRSLYSKRLEIISVNPDGNSLFPVTMYNCAAIGNREVALTYDLRDAVETSGNQLMVSSSLLLSFDFVLQSKFAGEMFDLTPAMTLSMARSNKVSLRFTNTQVTRPIDYSFVPGEYYKIELEWTKSLNQLSFKAFLLEGGSKTIAYQNIYIVNGGLNTDPFGSIPQQLIMYGGQWLCGATVLEIDTKSIINDSVNPILVMNKFGL